MGWKQVNAYYSRQPPRFGDFKFAAFVRDTLPRNCAAERLFFTGKRFTGVIALSKNAPHKGGLKAVCRDVSDLHPPKHYHTELAQELA